MDRTTLPFGGARPEPGMTLGNGEVLGERFGSAPSPEAQAQIVANDATKQVPAEQEGFWGSLRDRARGAWTGTQQAASWAGNQVADSWVGQKVTAGATWVGDKATEGARAVADSAVGRTVADATRTAVDGIGDGLKWTGDQVRTGLDWAGETRVGQAAKTAVDTVSGWSDTARVAEGRRRPAGRRGRRDRARRGAGADWATAKTADIPLLGTATWAAGELAKGSTQLSGGFVKGAGSLVEGVGDAVLHPVRTAQGLYSLAEHVPVLPGGVNPLKAVHNLYDVAAGHQTMSDALGRTFDPTGNAQENKEFWTKVGSALIEPYQKSIEDGKPLEAVGRGVFDLLTLVGTGGAGGATKAGEVLSAVDKGKRGAELVSAVRGESTAARAITEGADAAKGATIGEVTAGTAARPMETTTRSLDGHVLHKQFNKLSGEAQGAIRGLEAAAEKSGKDWSRLAVPGGKVTPESLVEMSKFAGREVAVVKSATGELHYVMGNERGIPASALKPGESFVVHTHPVMTTRADHFGVDLQKAGKQVEGVYDWCGQLTCYRAPRNKLSGEQRGGLVNDVDPVTGVVKPLPRDYRVPFLDDEGKIVGPQ